jgi:hypothetical protein
MLQTLHSNICERILTGIPGLQTCSSYPRIRYELLAPACFVEIESFEPGTDPGTNELAVIANFSAKIVMDRTVPNSEFAIRELALKLANLINKNTWNSVVSPAKIKDIGPDAFSPELDAYLVWNVGWTHELHVGKNVWLAAETAALPHVITVNLDALP